MELLPIHGQAACALVLAVTLAAAPLVVAPHDSGPACQQPGESGPAPGFAALGDRPPPACTRVELP